MKIAEITVWAKALRLSKPYFLHGGRLKFDVLDSTFVRLVTDDGTTGWGEACPWGHTYVPAHGPGIRAGIETLAPFVLGADPTRPAVLGHVMDAALPGHLYVKSAIDMAALDIAGQAAGVPISTLLGGGFGGATWVASSVSTGAPEEMLERIQDFHARGYRVHSAKVGADVAQDLARIRYLETHRAPDDRIFYDVNRAWTRPEALQVMNALADLPVAFEQPCETLEDCAAVRRLTRHPISIDERLETLSDMARIVGEGIGEIANIKINRVGGLTKAAQIRDMALAGGCQIAVMATGGSVLADTEAAHLAQTIPEARRFGGWSCQDMIDEDPAPGRGARVEEGRIAAPTAPGLGVAPDLDWLGAPSAAYGAS